MPSSFGKVAPFLLSPRCTTLLRCRACSSALDFPTKMRTLRTSISRSITTTAASKPSRISTKTSRNCKFCFTAKPSESQPRSRRNHLGLNFCEGNFSLSHRPILSAIFRQIFTGTKAARVLPAHSPGGGRLLRLLYAALRRYSQDPCPAAPHTSHPHPVRYQ